MYFASVLERLGIAEEMRPKTKLLTTRGRVAELVAKGEVELGVQLISEILSVPGAELLGPLPSELQTYTGLTAGVGVSAKEPGAAAVLIKFLTSPDAIHVIKSKGMEPG